MTPVAHKARLQGFCFSGYDPVDAKGLLGRVDNDIDAVLPLDLANQNYRLLDRAGVVFVVEGLSGLGGDG